jgi:integrase
MRQVLAVPQLRHAFASQLLTAGMPAEWVAAQLGHTTPEMLRRRYGKWITQDAPVSMSALANQRIGLNPTNGKAS